LPKVGSIDDGTWRRISVVPFNAQFKGRRDIKGYADILYYHDADAILGWIVEGAMQYISNRHDIAIPAAVEEATRQYRSAENWIENFINDCCDVGDYEESSGRLFAAYEQWCRKMNEWTRRQNDFVNALAMCGYEKTKDMYGAKWHGLKLNDEVEDIPMYSGWKRYTSKKRIKWGNEDENDNETLPVQGKLKM
jgi:phage/plasmid-associated DNA primase